MKRFLAALLALTFSSFSASTATAAPLLYEFDVHTDRIGFEFPIGSEVIFGPNGANLYPDDPRYAEFVNRYHALNRIRFREVNGAQFGFSNGGVQVGSSGRIGIIVPEFGIANSGPSSVSAPFCVYGFLCPVDSYTGMVFSNGNEITSAAGSNFFRVSFDNYLELGSGGSIRFNDDIDVLSPAGEVDGVSYFGVFGTADFTISNLRVTEVTPVPVPASLPLLAAGFGLLGLLRRKRSIK